MWALRDIIRRELQWRVLSTNVADIKCGVQSRLVLVNPILLRAVRASTRSLPSHCARPRSGIGQSTNAMCVAAACLAAIASVVRSRARQIIRAHHLAARPLSCIKKRQKASQCSGSQSSPVIHPQSRANALRCWFFRMFCAACAELSMSRTPIETQRNP